MPPTNFTSFAVFSYPSSAPAVPTEAIVAKYADKVERYRTSKIYRLWRGLWRRYYRWSLMPTASPDLYIDTDNEAMLGGGID
jgi:hypothetical protein